VNYRNHRTAHVHNSHAFHHYELKPVGNRYERIKIHDEEAGNDEKEADFYQRVFPDGK
jgi:hypothetical protein